ncbi:MAG: thiamine pyrophosphate-dependent enzyme [Thermoplasmataceae archaeon]
MERVTKMSKTVAEIIVDYLDLGGVERIYGVPGDSIDPLVESIRKKHSLKYVQVRHEEGGAFAASFDAKFNGRPAACFGTSGPGSIHLLNGLYDAKFDKAPVIAITGQVESGKVGMDYHQEVNLIKLFDDVSIFNRMVIDAQSAPYLVSRAVREAKRLRGVAHLNIPVNVLMQKLEAQDSISTEIPPARYNPILDSAIKLIQYSEHPVLLVGAGSLGEYSGLSALSEKIGAPIIYALLGKGILPDEDPRVFGGLGLLGSRPSLEAMQRSDLIIEIGSTFPYAKFIPGRPKIIQVDIDAGNLGKEFPVDIPVLSDSHTFINSVLPRLSDKKVKYYSEFTSSKKSWEKEIQGQEKLEAGKINPAELARILSEEVDKDSVIVTDTGNTTVWIARHFRAQEGQRFLFSGGLASMGGSLPGSIGISMSTNRQVVSAVGDGGFAMTSMELATVKKYNVPVKIVLFNNGKLAMIKFEQEVLGYPEWGVDLVNPDFSLLTSAYGIESLRIERTADIRSGVRKMLDHEGPFLLEAITDPNTRPMPPKVTFEQAKGFLMANIREQVGYEPEIEIR